MNILKNCITFIYQNKRIISILLILSFLLPYLNLNKIDFAEGAYTIDDSEGYFLVDFNGSTQGVAPPGPLRNGVNIDTIAGNVKLDTGSTTGFFTTIEITPNSFDGWKEVILDGNYANSNDVKVRLLDCSSTPTPISGPLGTYQTLIGGKLDISSLSSSTPCIRVQVELNQNSPIGPVINKLKATWKPLPVLLTNLIQASNTSQVGSNIIFQVKYSVSYARDTGVTVWVPLPNNLTNPGSIIYPDSYPATSSATSTSSAYGQDATPIFVEATNGGIYTSTTVVVNGVNIPANSVYWDLGTVNKGVTGNLGFVIKSINSLQNGIQYLLQSHIDSDKTQPKSSDADKNTPGNQPLTHTLLSVPDPKINKHRLVDNTFGGSQPYRFHDSSVVTYNIGYGNFYDDFNNHITPKTKNQETLFNAVLIDDISDILDKLQSPACGSLTLSQALLRISNITGGGVISGNTIVWPAINIDPNTSYRQKFDVSYLDCVVDTEIRNTAYLKADNTATITDKVDVKVGLVAEGIYAKGEFKVIRAGFDDNWTGDSYGNLKPSQGLVKWGDDVEYNMSVTNTGPYRIDDTIVFDKIPEGQTFVSAGSSNDQVITFYNTDGISNASNTPPTYSTTTPGVLGGTWTTTTPANLEDVVWVAYYIPSLSSPILKTPTSSIYATSPSKTILNLYTNITASNTASQCDIYTQANSALFKSYKVSNSINNEDGDMVDWNNSGFDTEITHISNKTLANLTASITPVVNVVNAPGQNTINIRVENTGVDASYNTIVTIPIPKTRINGEENKVIDFISVIGGVVTSTGTPISEVKVNLGTIPASSTKNITLKLGIPRGVENFTDILGNVLVSGEDDDNCATISTSGSYSFAVTSNPLVQIYKTRNESVIPSGGSIHYQIHYANLGSSPTHNQYIIDRIPANTIFEYAYTNGADDIGNTYLCPGCKVYFSKNVPTLPPGISPLEVFDISYITSNFSLGNEVSPGKWSSPFGSETLWIAYLSDNTQLSYPNFATTRVGSVGLQVKNDADGAGPGTAGSPEGDVVVNEAAVFADEILQAISNQVITTILPEAGFALNKKSSIDYISAGLTFDWTIDYVNDTGNITNFATITDILPIGVTLNDIYNTWSNYTLTSPTSTPASGEQNITNHSCVSTSTLPDNRLKVEIVIAPCLRGADLFKLEGGKIRLSVTATNTLLTGAVLENEVEAYYHNASSSPAKTTDSDAVFIFNPDLWIRKQVNITDPLPGETIEYTLTVSNEGKGFASGTIITDILPPGLCYVSGSTAVVNSGWTLGEPTISGGPCNTATTTLTWNTLQFGTNTIGYIPGESEDIYIKYNVSVESTLSPGISLTNGAGVTNALPEDNVYSNGDTQEVIIPYPDLYILKSAPVTVEGGDSITYNIQYGNASKQPANNVYFIDTLPDFDNNGYSDVQIISVSGTGTKYYHSATGGAPTFNPLNPLSNGWTNAFSSTTNHIAILFGNMSGNAGPYLATIKVIAKDPITSVKTPAGTKLVNQVNIYTTDLEATTTNNLSFATTTIPSFDLSITKVGNKEGAYPGTYPGANQSYLLTIKNNGNTPVCGVYFVDNIPTGFIYNNISPSLDIKTKDESEQIVKFENPSGAEINTPVNLNIINLGSAYRYEIGSPHTNVCLKPNTSITFTISGQINNNLLDGEQVINTAMVGEDSPGVEDVLENNQATSTVSVWRADVLVRKDGFSCGADNICGNLDDNQLTTNPGEIIRYKIEYDNIGNLHASNTILEEIIPAGTCFRVGSISNIPGASIEYSNDNGSTWNYVPVGTPGSCDQNVTNFRVIWNVLQAPANAISIDTLEEVNNANTGDNRTNIRIGPTSTILGTTGSEPIGIIIDNFGNIYTANVDSNDVTKITPSGSSSIFATTGSGPIGIIIDNFGNIYTANVDSNDVTKITPSGSSSILGTTGSLPYYITIDNAGNIYTTNWNSNNVSKITPSGSSSILGTTGLYPVGITIDNAGNIYTTNWNSNNVSKITPSGSSSIFATTDSGPWGITIDNAGNIYTANYNSHNVSKITPSGSSFIFATTGNGPTDLIIDNAGNIYTTNWNSNNVSKITPSGSSSIFATTGSYPWGITIDNAGNIYTANTGSNNVTKIKVNQTSDIRLECPGKFFCFPSAYVTYTATTSVNNLAWDKFLVSHTIPNNTSVNYTLCKTNFPGVGDTCPNADIIYSGPVNQGYIDISSVPNNQNIYVRVDLESNATGTTPIVDSMHFSYRGDTPAFTFEVRVTGLNGSTPVSNIYNTVSINTESPEKNTNNNNASDNIQLNQADLKITKSVNKASALSGDTLIYTLDYVNQGPSAANKVSVIDNLPYGVNYVSAISNTPGVTCTYNLSLHRVTCTKTNWSLAVNESGKITITVNVSTSTPDLTLVNNANILSSTTDPSLSNNSASANTVIGDYANTYIQKSGPSKANVNSQIAYNINFGNNGTVNATNTYIIDTFDPAELSFVSATITTSQVGLTLICTSATPGTIICDQNGADPGGEFTLNAGATGTATITLQVANDFNLLINNEIIENNIAIYSSSTETNIIDNYDDHNVPIWPLGYSSISGYEYIDKNKNNKFDSGESGLEGVMITLTGVDIYGNDVLRVTVTDSNGFYSFGGLNPGVYTITASQPNNYASFGAQAGYIAPATSTSIGIVDGTNQIKNINLGELQNSVQNNFAEIAGEIGNIVWDDINNNGILDAGELGIGGVEVYAYYDANNNGIVDLGETAYVKTTRSSSQVIGTTTYATGTYEFTDLPLGQYIILVNNLSPVLVTNNYIPAVLGTPGVDNHNQNSNGYIVNLTTSNPVNYTADFGYRIPVGAIGNQIWFDVNNNGYFDIGEIGLENIVVELLSSTGTLLQSTTTNILGQYLFENLPINATYTIKVDTSSLPSYISTSTHNATTSTTTDGYAKDISGYSVYLSVATDTNLTADFGFTTFGTLSGTIFFDRDLDGYNDGGTNEPGLENILVELLDQTNTVIAATTTNSTGDYVFNNLLVNATYTIRVATSTLPTWAQVNTGLATTTDNSTDNYGHVNPISIYLSTTESSNSNLDFSFASTGTIGNQVFQDVNLNGTYDSGIDMPLIGWLVSLFIDNDNDQVLSTSSGDTLYATTTTDSNGNYTFTNLPLVNYIVTITNNLISNFLQIIGANPNSDNNAQQNNYPVSLSTSTPINNTADFGYRVIQQNSPEVVGGGLLCGPCGCGGCDLSTSSISTDNNNVSQNNLNTNNINNTQTFTDNQNQLPGKQLIRKPKKRLAETSAQGYINLTIFITLIVLLSLVLALSRKKRNEENKD